MNRIPGGVKSRGGSVAATALSLLIGAVGILPTPAFCQEGGPLIVLLEQELKRNFSGLKERGKDPLYYLAYEIHETEYHCITAQFGALTRECSSHGRELTIDVRVGSPALDNTHEVRDRWSFDFPSFAGTAFPLEDLPEAVAVLLWSETDKAFKKAQEKLARVRANRQVKAEEADSSPDFSREDPHRMAAPLAPAAEDLESWAPRVKEYSLLLAAKPEYYESKARIDVTRENRYLCSSEGTSVQSGNILYRLQLEVKSLAGDGMELPLNRTYYARSLRELPDDATVRQALARLTSDLDALREAPLVEPYVGPAILMHEAAAVFFHEILGHRLEGSELKSEQSGQTFKGQVGSAVTSPLVSVSDDPARESFGDQILVGHYRHDDEGQPARRALLVEDGLLRGFLMNRTPITGFERSNGHGRREAGRQAASRQGNLIVAVRDPVPYQTLVERLLQECRRQGKPWGLIFADVSGGFTSTGRWSPNAFKVIPLLVYRISAEDGRMTLVRGVDIIGTPLQAFTKILAGADDPRVFNGYCGASSGNVPVSAISPSLLFAEVEVQKKEPGRERPPILAAPEPPAGMDAPTVK